LGVQSLLNGVQPTMGVRHQRFIWTMVNDRTIAAIHNAFERVNDLKQCNFASSPLDENPGAV
jgi:hypothetical protein